MKVLAVIPARGGSKGLPGKNVRPLDGVPLLVYSIAAAKQAKLVTRVICTTDSIDIAEIANKHGAETPFLRPPALAGDNSTDLEVFTHLLKWLWENEKYMPNVIVQLRPTSPLRPLGFVDKGVRKLLSNGNIDSLRTICPAPSTPYKMWTIAQNTDFLNPLLKIDGCSEPYNAPRQNLPEVWWQVGLLDVIYSRVIADQDSMSGKNISYIKVDTSYAVDIDTIADFQTAERIIGTLECVRP